MVKVIVDIGYCQSVLPVLSASDDHLKDTNTGPSLPLPVLGVGVQSLQHIKSLGMISNIKY